MAIKLISWNVNGIRSIVKKGFKDFVRKEKPEVICLQETKGKVEGILKEEGYEEYWNNGVKKGYSGTAVFVSSKPLNVNYGLGLEEHDKEGRVITLEFPEFFLVNVYTPNAKRGLARLPYRIEWDRDFLDYLKKLGKKKQVVLCGDLNVAHKEIDLTNPAGNRKNAGFTEEERRDFSRLIESGFIDTFREFDKSPGKYSWWTYMFGARRKNIGWRIDYFCISKELRKHLTNAFILEKVMGSDHAPVGIILDI